jgi:hypothetical protein
LNETTQLKIEKYLINQAQILIDKRLAHNISGNISSNSKLAQAKIVNSKIDSELIKQTIYSGSRYFNY